MPAPLPPLTTLLAFEAVARRRSFALAAGELSLTASAVSHQIARLEAFLGTKLFERSSTTGVRLSAAGAHYLQRVGSALGALGAATNDVRQGVRNSLYVHASPSFASLWLMPRLPAFAKAHPDVSLSLSASPMHSDFAIGQVDLEVRYGLPQWPNLVVEPLFEEHVLPLASPALARRLALRVREPGQLLDHDAPLIQSTVGIVQWGDWLSAQGVTQSPARFALRFDRAQLALDAAVQGLGVALESSTLAARHIEQRRLVPLFDAARALPVRGHFVVFPARHAKRPEVAAFAAWLHEQAGAMPDPLAARRPRPAPAGARRR